MREILVYDDYEIHKLGAGGGTQYEEVTTEKATRIDVTDVAKPKGKLIPFGRTTQTQLTGKNKCDGIFEQGSISSSGADTLADNRIRLKNYAEVSPSTTYTFKTNSTYSLQVYVFEYDENKDFIQRIPSTWIELPYTFATSVTTKYIRVICAKDNTENISPSDVYNTQLELDATATDYEPYCGGQPSPNPDYPQEIENVEGRSCTNLFNKNGDFNYPTNVYVNATTLLEDGTIQTTANAQSIASRGLRLFLKPNTDYVVSGKLLSSTGTGYTSIARVRLMGYKTSWGALTEKNLNEIGNFSFSFNSGDNTDWFLSLNAMGTIGNNYVAIYDEIQINEGSTVLPYEPYFEGKRLEFVVGNKNLFDNEWEIGIINGNTGLNQDNNNYIRAKNFIPVKELTNYKISDAENIFNKMNVYEYKSDFSYNLSSNKTIYTYLTTEKDTAYIRIRPGVSTTDTSVKVQIEEGTTATSYEEHKEQMIPFPLAEGQKLMEGDYLASDGIHHIRGKVILDGTENWAGYTDSGTTARVYLLYDGIKKGGNVLCNKLKQTYYDSDTEGIGIYPYQTSLFYIKLNKSRLTSENVAGIKTWLIANPLVVEYELAEEVIEPYTPAQQEAYSKLMNLMLYKGVNHIWTNTDGLEPNLQLTYKRKKQSNVLQVSNIQPLNNLELNNTEETPEEITTEISEE